MSTWVQTFTAFPGAWSEEKYARFNPPSKLKKSLLKEYGDWAARQPKSVMCCLKPSKGNPRFAVMDRPVKMRFGFAADGSKAPLDKPKVYRQRNVVSIDPKCDYAGNIYNTDKKIILYFKFFLSFLARPVHLIIKTAYHLFLIGVFVAIAKELKSKKGEKAALKKGELASAVPKPIDKAAGTLGQKVVRSLVDIFRTPLYELVMTIVSLTAILTAPFSPGLLYDFRCFTGQLTRELFWGAKYDMPVNLTPCMYRVGNIMDFEKNPQSASQAELVVYKDPSNRTLTALDNWMVDDVANIG
jgi:hypothetical protein